MVKPKPKNSRDALPASALFNSCRSSDEELFVNIFEEIPDTNTDVSKNEEKFKTFTWSKVSCNSKNETEDEEKRYDESREPQPLKPMLLFTSDFLLTVQQIVLNYGLKILITKVCLCSTVL